MRFLLLFVLLPGCTISRLDLAQHDITQKSISTGLLFAEAMKGFADGADRMATAKHSLQNEVIALDDDIFWNGKTNSEGRLVSLVNGKEEPILRSDVEQFIKDREVSIAKRMEDERRWGLFSGGFQRQIGMYEASLNHLKNTEATIFEKRQSVEASFNQTLAFIGTSLAALGFGL